MHSKLLNYNYKNTSNRGYDVAYKTFLLLVITRRTNCNKSWGCNTQQSTEHCPYTTYEYGTQPGDNLAWENTHS